MEEETSWKELKDWCQYELREAKELLELAVNEGKIQTAQFHDGRIHVLEHLKNTLSRLERKQDGK